jgi:hypothetical protein
MALTVHWKIHSAKTAQMQCNEFDGKFTVIAPAGFTA